jgi:CubicO group peptidase (beta-lactamase class C family)
MAAPSREAGTRCAAGAIRTLAGLMLTALEDISRLSEVVVVENPSADSSAGSEICTSPTKDFLASRFADGIRLSYGLGWGLYWTPYGKAFFKEGHDDGWRNYTLCFDEKKMGIVIMTNSSNGEGIYKELLESLQRNTFRPIEWEQFTPYNAAPK